MADYVSTSQGRVGYALPQPYSTTAAYKKRDVVQYQGGSYVVLLDGVSGIAPDDDGVNYRILCARGEAGESNAEWYTGTAVSGRASGVVAGVPGSKAGDMYLNSETSDLYRASAPDTWDWAMNLGEAVSVTAENVPTSDGVSVQEALDELAGRTASDIPIADGGTVQGALDVQATALQEIVGKIDKQLWAGSISNGETAIVPEIGNYKLFYCITSLNATPILCATNNDRYIRGNAIYASASTGNHQSAQVSLLRTGESVQLVVASSMVHNSNGSHGAVEALNLTSIYGLM